MNTKNNFKKIRYRKKKPKLISILRKRLRANDLIYRPLNYTFNITTDGSGNYLGYTELANQMQTTSDWTAMIGAYKRYYVTSCYVTVTPNGSDAQDGVCALGYHPYLQVAPTSYNQVVELKNHTVFANKRGSSLGFPVRFVDGVDNFKSVGTTWVFGTLQWAITSNTLNYPVHRVNVTYHVYWSAYA